VATDTQRAAGAGLLLERERELGALHDAVAGVGRGEGRVVLVEGPPGVGKTRLVADARAAARRAGVLVLEARGAELERDFAFGVARQLLEAVALGGGDELFAGAAGTARRLFADGQAEPAPMEAGFATLHGLYWLVVNLGDRAPVLVAVDDAHWADEPSLRFLDYLTHRVEGVPIAVVLAGRPPEDGVWAQLAAQADAQVLRPRPLSAEAVDALVRARLGEASSDELSAACHAATKGNPLFLRELLGELEARGGSASPADVAALGPAAVARFVRRRLASLGRDAGELASAVAVLGDGADPALAGAVAGIADVGPVVDALVRADVLAAGERLSFVHPIVRAAVYEDLAPGERQDRHAAAAAILARTGAAPERVAAHVVLSGHADASVLRAAAASALQRGAPSTAVRYLRRALDDPAAASDRADLLTELGWCELAAAELAAADQHLRAAVALDAPPAVRVRAAALLARAAVLVGGDVAELAASTLEALADELREADREASLGLGGDLLTLSETTPPLRAALPARLERFRSQATGDERYEAVAEVHAANAFLLRGGDAAVAANRVEAALARGLPERAATSTLFIALSTLISAERHDPTARWLAAGLEGARREGHAARQAILLGELAVIALARGELDDALVDAETGMAVVDARHFVWLQLVAVATVVHLERGDLDAAAATIALGEDVDTTRERLFLDDFLVARGRVRIAQGELQRGAADLLDCGALLERLEIRWRCDWRAHLLAALTALGDDERARTLAREHLEVVRAVGAPGALGRGLRTAGAAVGGEEGLALLEEAVAVLQRSPARLELAHALRDLGAELGRRRRRREGREALRAGMELAARCGARALAERARSELVAGGGRRPRLELTGAGALTPAERRVCELAAAGDLTNRAIAQSLFVTEKTVELHLSNAYRKLGIRSRFQLAESLNA
jgi:DNA-binding CsgD family transcriptional regulator